MTRLPNGKAAHAARFSKTRRIKPKAQSAPASGFDETTKIWFNGKMIRWQEATVHVMSHVIHYGSSVFEGFRCYNTQNGPSIFRLKDHIDRLFDSAKIYRIKIPFTLEALVTACRDVVRENGLLNGAYIRPIAYRGYGEMGVAGNIDQPANVSVAAWEWGSYLGEGGLDPAALAAAEAGDVGAVDQGVEHVQPLVHGEQAAVVLGRALHVQFGRALVDEAAAGAEGRELRPGGTCVFRLPETHGAAAHAAAHEQMSGVARVDAHDQRCVHRSDLVPSRATVGALEQAALRGVEVAEREIKHVRIARIDADALAEAAAARVAAKIARVMGASAMRRNAIPG